MSLGKNKAKIYVEDDVGIVSRMLAGVDEAKFELEEVINFLKEPERFTRLAARYPEAFCWWVPRAPARPFWPRPWRGKATCRFSA
jgi:cell division protease FtsH